MPKVSIIIPVYKAESYIRRCLNSILAQTFKDYEVILVDDGSPDSSGTICDDYAQKFKTFKVIHKLNGGVSSARQIGIEHACGDYSIQFDPDDWVESNMLELMYDKAIAENADFVVCDMYRDYPNKTIIVSHKQRPKNIDSLYDFFLTGRFPASLANKLIRHRLYLDNDFSFDNHVTRWEDTQAVCTLMLRSNRISFVDKPLYHYDFHSNQNSLARNATISGLKSQITVCEYFYQKLKETNHVPAVNNMRLSTKELAYDILNSSDYIDLYKELNNYICKQGIFCHAGISGYFMAMTILTKSNFPQYLYKRLRCLKK